MPENDQAWDFEIVVTRDKETFPEMFRSCFCMATFIDQEGNIEFAYFETKEEMLGFLHGIGIFGRFAKLSIIIRHIFG